MTLLTRFFPAQLASMGDFADATATVSGNPTIPNGDSGALHEVTSATSNPFSFPGGQAELSQTMSVTIDGLTPGDDVFFNIPNGSHVDPSAIPEPTSIALFGIGVLGMAGYGWRRRKQAIA